MVAAAVRESGAGTFNPESWLPNSVCQAPPWNAERPRAPPIQSSFARQPCKRRIFPDDESWSLTRFFFARSLNILYFGSRRRNSFINTVLVPAFIRLFSAQLPRRVLPINALLESAFFPSSYSEAQPSQLTQGSNHLELTSVGMHTTSPIKILRAYIHTTGIQTYRELRPSVQTQVCYSQSLTNGSNTWLVYIDLDPEVQTRRFCKA